MSLWKSADEAIAWAEGQAWTKRMAACPQDKQYHAEGDAWTHTKMVLGKLAEHPEWPKLPQADRSILIAGALFHDCGKPDTVVEQNGRITSRGHSRVGAKLTRMILRKQGIPQP
jgi:putative nucleotidyltransferase with HDIG domain